MIDNETQAAIAQAKKHALKGLEAFPFDTVYKTTLEQVAWIEHDIREQGSVSKVTKSKICLGLMAAKELGNDEADFAHALHVINFWVDAQE
jgi:hypothetical protein